MTLLERFEQKYIPEPNSGCWLWIGASMSQHSSLPSQYGLLYFWQPRRTEAAHRISYKLHRGDIPQGMNVLHRCDNPCCVNPDHLFLGTVTDNHNDMVAKGRNSAARGTNNHNAKLTDDLVREIRLSQETAKQLAYRFGVDKRSIRSIKRGTAWRHVA